MVYDTTHFKTSLGLNQSASHVFPSRKCSVKGEYDRNIIIYFSLADCNVTLILYKTYKTQQVKFTNNQTRLNSHDC